MAYRKFAGNGFQVLLREHEKKGERKGSKLTEMMDILISLTGVIPSL